MDMSGPTGILPILPLTGLVRRLLVFQLDDRKGKQ